MQFEITYNMGGMLFTATANGASEAFDYVKAIIRENKIMYPNQEEALDNYLCIVADIAAKNMKAFNSGCGLFSIEGISE